jgi:hypothetical protein
MSNKSDLHMGYKALDKSISKTPHILRSKVPTVEKKGATPVTGRNRPFHRYPGPPAVISPNHHISLVAVV